MPDFDVDEELVRKLSGLLEETGLSEIEYEAGGRRIRVARGGAAAVTAAGPQTPAPRAAETSREAAAPGPEAPPAGAVISPMVGTVYVAPEPGSPAFVSVGDDVREGQTLLIIEAMKVMNQIPSPRSGRVTRILISDGQPVEFGEPLLVIE
jgi:acetyl-CoA carboxylase biotin carboxyl carrier protein